MANGASIVVPGTHTLGPWQAVSWTCHAATTVKARDIVVAECSGFGRYADESLGDARLIAAAPELLNALLGVLAIAETGVTSLGALRAARAAIAKATRGAA